jgi:hypothetical protein
MPAFSPNSWSARLLSGARCLHRRSVAGGTPLLPRHALQSPVACPAKEPKITRRRLERRDRGAEEHSLPPSVMRVRRTQSGRDDFWVGREARCPISSDTTHPRLGDASALQRGFRGHWPAATTPTAPCMPANPACSVLDSAGTSARLRQRARPNLPSERALRFTPAPFGALTQNRAGRGPSG